ncbi:hypothetical protein ABZS63_24785, partial [Streptomyces sp. NPDC005568]
FVEVDNCTETAQTLSAKFEKYAHYFRLTTKGPQGRELPVWRTRYAPTGRDGHPPVAVVFNQGTRIGPEGLKNRMNAVLQQTRDIWSGTYQPRGSYGGKDRDGYYNYADAIPLMFTTLDRLQEQGPCGTVWWRCGHDQWETLTDALANPKDYDAYAARDQARQAELDTALDRQPWGARDDWAAEPPTPIPVPARVPVSVPCRWCGLPVTSSQDQDDNIARPEDGHYCPECRTDTEPQLPYPTLRQALFGRRSQR